MELLGALAQELTQLNGLSASFFRAAAARIGVTVTDMQVIESLSSAGPLTAGQLAELTGLTTGAITGMLNRLEEAGLVRRERDPEDGRKVIVRLTPDSDQIRGIGAIFGSIRKAWEEQTARYDDEQIAFLVDFLKHTNAIAKQENLWLRETPQRAEDVTSAPLGDLTHGELVFPKGIGQLTVRAGRDIAELYQARFEGPVPEVKTADGVVTGAIRDACGCSCISGAASDTRCTGTLGSAYRLAYAAAPDHLDRAADVGKWLPARLRGSQATPPTSATAEESTAILLSDLVRASQSIKFVPLLDETHHELCRWYLRPSVVNDVAVGDMVLVAEGLSRSDWAAVRDQVAVAFLPPGLQPYSPLSRLLWCIPSSRPEGWSRRRCSVRPDASPVRSVVPTRWSAKLQ